MSEMTQMKLKTLAIPALVTLMIYAVTVALATFVGSRFENHDTGMLAALLLGLFGGVGAGMAGVLTWLWRNP